MRITTLFRFILLLSVGLLLLGAGTRPGPGNYNISGPENCESDECSEITVTGHSMGNHELDCTVIQPWSVGNRPTGGSFPVIVWANGWDWNDNAGEFITAGYKPGLIEWALDGPYIVVAANQWSVQESDVLQCLQWVIDQNADRGEYEGLVNTGKIGLAGHSQGGGVVIKAGDGGGEDVTITATIPMNPYGPSWVNPGKQDGPMLLIGGSNDTTTPTSSFEKVWQAIQSNGQGGLLWELQGGTHNDDAWAPEGQDPEENDFGRYQDVTELWWQIYLKGSGNLVDLENLLVSEGYWDFQFT